MSLIKVFKSTRMESNNELYSFDLSIKKVLNLSFMILSLSPSPLFLLELMGEKYNSNVTLI